VSRLSLVGLSHKNASLPLREKVAVVSQRSVFDALRRREIAEAVVLSTCNRFEIYARCPGDKLLDVVESLAGEPLRDQAYVRENEEAIRHLFEVASGLDSLVVGETEILGQVKAAYELAKAAGMTDKRTNVIFQRALYTGKKVRSETAITVGQTSVASVAVELAASIFGSLAKSEVLILGAGAMAELTARHLLSKKVAKLTIANRTWERGAELAKRLTASALPWERFESAFETADIVVASTGSDKPVVRREAVAAAMAKRAGRSLFFIDIAMPRDVEEGVHSLEHVYAYRLEDLESIAQRNLASRGKEVDSARALARAKAAELWRWYESLSSGQEISLKHSDREEAVS